MTKNRQTIEAVTVSDEKRRRWSAAEKAALVREMYEPGMSVSLVAPRKHGISASQLFNWHKLDRDGALTAAYFTVAGQAVLIRGQPMFGNVGSHSKNKDCPFA